MFEFLPQRFTLPWGGGESEVQIPGYHLVNTPAILVGKFSNKSWPFDPEKCPSFSSPCLSPPSASLEKMCVLLYARTPPRALSASSSSSSMTYFFLPCFLNRTTTAPTTLAVYSSCNLCEGRTQSTHGKGGRGVGRKQRLFSILLSPPLSPSSFLAVEFNSRTAAGTLSCLKLPSISLLPSPPSPPPPLSLVNNNRA